MVEISQNFVVFSEDINFNSNRFLISWICRWQNISISKKFRILATSLSTPLSLRRGWVYAAWFQGYFSDITLEIQTDETEVQSDLYRHLIKGLVFHSWYKGALVRAWLVRFVDEAGKTMMMNGQNSQWPRTTDTQWRHKSKKSENLGRCGRQNMLRSYLKIWEWELIFVRAVKAISSPGVCIPCQWPYNTFIHILSIPYIYNEAKSFLRYLRIIPLCSSTFIRFKNSDNVFRNYRIL